jgi:hypothetical protein
MYTKENHMTFREKLTICDELIADFNDKSCRPFLDESGYNEVQLERALLIDNECLCVAQRMTDVSYCEHWICETGEYLMGFNDEDELVAEINMYA